MYVFVVKLAFEIGDGKNVVFKDQDNADIDTDHLANIVFKYRNSDSFILHVLDDTRVPVVAQSTSTSLVNSKETSVLTAADISKV